MNFLKKIQRDILVRALIPLSGLEAKERDRRLLERLKRLEQKQKYQSSNVAAFKLTWAFLFHVWSYQYPAVLG